MSEYTPSTAVVHSWMSYRGDHTLAEFKRWFEAEITKAVDLGYLAALRMAAYQAENYTGHPYNAAATLALGFTAAADEMEKED